MNKKYFDESDFFVGREKELTQLYAIVREAQNFETGALINLWGIKGIGKTAFLKQVCRKGEHIIGGRPVMFVTSYMNLASLKTKEEVKENLITSFVTGIKALNVSEDNIASSQQMTSGFVSGENSLDEVFLPFASFGTLVFAFDDFHLLENSDPKLAQYFLDEIAIPLLRFTKAIVILAGNYSLGSNPNIDKDQKIKIDKIPSLIKLGGLGLDELRLLLQSQISSKINAREDLVDLVFTYTAGHPLLILLALKYITDSKFVPDSWVEVKEESQRIILGDHSNEKNYDLRMQCLPALRQLSIFRTFSVGLLEEVNIDFIGFEGQPAHQLINYFLRANLISYDPVKGGYVIDQVIRQIIESRLFLDDLGLWNSTHLCGFNLYYNLLLEYPIKSDTYLLEFVYHALSLLKIDSNFGSVFVNGLEKLKVDFENDSFLSLVLNDVQIQLLVKSTSVEHYLKSLHSWVLNPGKGLQKMEHNKEILVSVEVEKLIGEERNQQFKRIWEKIRTAQTASVMIEGNGGIGKSDILRRIVKMAKNYGDVDTPIVVLEKGIIDLAVPVNRDPIYIMQWIANNLFGGSFFEKFNEGYDNYKKSSVYSRVLVSNETSIDDLFPVWVEEYNHLVSSRNCKILLAFDTTEKLYEISMLNDYLRYMLRGREEKSIPPLKNTIFVVAGRSINKLLFNDLHKYSNENALEERLEPLEDNDTKKYFESMGVKIKGDDEKTYFSLAQGYPVIISLLAALSIMPDGKVVLGSIEQEEKVKSAIEKVDRKKPETLSIIFQRICRQYVGYIKSQFKDETNSLNLYDLIVQIRRGIDGKLLSFLDGDKKEVYKYQDDIAKWRDIFKPLIKEIPGSFLNENGRGFYVVAHDVIFEHANPDPKTWEARDQRAILERVVRFYHSRRDDFIKEPSLIGTNPEVYLSVLQDRIFYEFVLNPWKSLCVLSQEIHDAYRQGELLLMQRLWEEWKLLVDDKIFKDLITPSKEFYILEEELLEYRKKILLGEVDELSEKMQSLLNKISTITSKAPNIDAEIFLDGLKNEIDVELAKVNILNGGFSDSLNFKKSIDTLETIISAGINDPSFNRKVLADAYSGCGLYWMQLMRYDKAYEEYQRAFPLYRNLNLYPDMARCQSQLSLLAALQGLNSKAEQHYFLANELVVNLSKDSPIVSLVERNLAHLYLVNGNLRRAGIICEGLVSHTNYLPSYEQALHWLSFIEIKSKEIAFSLILKDLISPDSGNQIDIIDDYYKRMTFSWKSPLTIFDLEYAKSEFYLFIVKGMRLLSKISSDEKNQDQLIERAYKSWSGMNGIKQDSENIFGWRLLTFYLIESELSFMRGDYKRAEEANVVAQSEIARITNIFLEEKRRSFLPDFDNLGKLFVELYALEGRVFLMAGHILLLKGAEKRDTFISVLEFYDQALKQLLLHPNRMYLNFAYEEIRFQLLNLFKDEKKLNNELNKTIDEMGVSKKYVGLQYLRENLPLRIISLY